jgi:hypothetical protein
MLSGFKSEYLSGLHRNLQIERETGWRHDIRHVSREAIDTIADLIDAGFHRLAPWFAPTAKD